MTIPQWSTVFTDNVSTISAAFLNYLRTYLPRAVDGVSGGVITPSAVIEVQGTAGFKINGSGSAARLQYGSETVVHTVGAQLVNLDTGEVDIASIVIGTPAEQGTQSLLLPDGARLTAVTAYHHRTAGSEPVARVSLQIFKSDITTGTPTQIGATTTDSSGNLAAYELHHGFSISGLSETIDRTKYVYYILFNGESGGSATTTTWHGCTVTVVPTSQDKVP